METIAILREHDVYPDRKPVSDDSYEYSRQATRMILRDEEGNVAVHYFPLKDNMSEGYMLPGGGIEEGESPEQGLRREAMEETGCMIEDIKELGHVLEYGAGKKTKHIQNEYLYSANVQGDKGVWIPEQVEIDRGVELRWMPASALYAAISAQKPSFSQAVALIALRKYFDLK